MYLQSVVPAKAGTQRGVGGVRQLAIKCLFTLTPTLTLKGEGVM